LYGNNIRQIRCLFSLSVILLHMKLLSTISRTKNDNMVMSIPSVPRRVESVGPCCGNRVAKISSICLICSDTGYTQSVGMRVGHEGLKGNLKLNEAKHNPQESIY